MPETDGGVVGGDVVVLVAGLLVHDTATSPENTTIAKASRFILLIPTPHRADHGVRFDSFDPTRRGVVDDAGRGLDDLSRMSRQVLEDVACDAAAGFLFPSERDGLEQAGHQRVVPDVADAAGQSIVDYVFQELAGILGGSVARNAVAWQQYAEGILEKGNQDAAACRG